MNTDKTTSKASETAEVLDSTGNMLCPGMYGYETALARRDYHRLMRQRASDKCKASAEAESAHTCDQCGCDLSYSSLPHCAKCHRELWTARQ